MDSAKNKRSFMFGIPGAALQVVGILPLFVVDSRPLMFVALVLVLALAGTALLLRGLALYAEAKGQSAAWCLMAFLSIIGLIVLDLLPDRTLEREDTAHADGQPDDLSPTVTTDRKPVNVTSALAVWSLVLGLLSCPATWLAFIPMFVLAVSAITCGHLSRHVIRHRPGTLPGGATALLGLIAGYSVLACTLVTYLIARLFYGS